MSGKMSSKKSKETRIEIGSFIELELKKCGEYFDDGPNTARLNSGRSGIYHVLRILKCSTIYLPYYLCPDVRNFLEEKLIRIKYYNINNDFEPILEKNESNSAVLIVNYFGIFSRQKLLLIKERYRNPIIDNCGAFFMQNLQECYNIYSCRKFFGVPDGSYVIGPNAGLTENDYMQDYSSDTSSFLLKRIEYGCSTVYQERMKNEERINKSGVLKMSLLTKSILCSLDYEFIKSKRMHNYKYVSQLYRTFNLISPDLIKEEVSVPLFYPLVIKDKSLVEKLQSFGIYTGRRWIHVLKEVKKNSFEAFLTSYLVPIPVDQRYTEKELDFCFNSFRKSLVNS